MTQCHDELNPPVFPPPPPPPRPPLGWTTTTATGKESVRKDVCPDRWARRTNDPEIVFESCWNPEDKAKRGVTGRVRETDMKHGSQEWRQKRERKKMRVINQSHPSDKSSARTSRHTEAGRDAALTWEHSKINLLPLGISLIQSTELLSVCYYGDSNTNRQTRKTP